MSFNAKILADSVSPQGVRLTTFEVTFPRIVLAEFNTHRVLSRNSASSRAIPVEKMIRRVREDPYIPSSWGKNQKGMQAGEELSGEEADLAKAYWYSARNDAVKSANRLLELGIHKQTTNRLLEPFMWHTCIVTATEWSNLFHLRNNPKAHPDIQTPVRMMQELYEGTKPTELAYGAWHMPLIKEDDIEEALQREQQVSMCGFVDRAKVMLRKISVGRCARISYLTHDGKRDITEDIRLHDDLLRDGHLSPFEHVATPAGGRQIENMWSGNFRGWVQYRKTIPGEADILGTVRG